MYISESKYGYSKVLPEITKYKEKLVKVLKINMSQVIESKYPPYRQMNASIGLYGEEYKEEMMKFINKCRFIEQELEDQITMLTYATINDIDITIENIFKKLEK